jgi:hypothetical protein
LGISKPPRLTGGDLFLSFGAIAFPIHVWAIVNVLEVFPAWLLRLSLWELAGALGYSLAFAFLESGILWAVFVAFAYILPRRWLADKFVASSSLLAWLLAAWAILAQFIFGRILLWGLWGAIGAAVLAVASLGLAAWLVRRFTRLEQGVKWVTQRLAVLTYLYIFFDLLGLVVILLRNL